MVNDSSGDICAKLGQSCRWAISRQLKLSFVESENKLVAPLKSVQYFSELSTREGCP